MFLNCYLCGVVQQAQRLAKTLTATLKNVNKNDFFLIILSIISLKIFAQSKIINDTIPFKLNEYNTVFIKAIFNEIDTLNLNFDTGTTELILTKNTLKIN